MGLRREKPMIVVNNTKNFDKKNLLVKWEPKEEN